MDAMLHLKEVKKEQNCYFKWGTKRGIGKKNKNTQFYESFIYYGVEYFLYDCAYFHHFGDAETYIGKLVGIYETETREKKVKVVWFFRPIEVQNFLGDYEPRWNEIFLASGAGEGLSDINALEAIGQKCNVICASKDNRNPRASEEELRMADYIFLRTFDVGKYRILETFPDQIDRCPVKHFFNKERDIELINPSILKPTMKGLTVNSGVLDRGTAMEYDKPASSCSSSVVKGCKKAACSLGRLASNSNGSTSYKMGHAAKGDKCGSSRTVLKESKKPANRACQEVRVLNENSTLRDKSSIDHDGIKSGRILCNQVNEKARRASFEDSLSQKELKIWPLKKRKLTLDGKGDKVFDNAGPSVKPGHGVKAVGKNLEDKAHRFKLKLKELPLEERLRRAYEGGRLVVLENLDPSLTSSEVEDLFQHALNKRVVAMMIERSTFSSPYNGQALVIFESKGAAEFAMVELKRRCLMLEDGRPVVGRRATLKEPGKPGRFVGHAVIDKLRPKKQSEEMQRGKMEDLRSQLKRIQTK